MILIGCLLAFTAALAPRIVLILAWIFSDRWVVVWQNNILLPLLGIVFLPYTTVMYMLAWSPAVGGGGGIEGWDWMWIILGLFLDFWKWSQMFANRKEAQTMKYYPSDAPRNTGTGSGAAAVDTPAPDAAVTEEGSASTASQEEQAGKADWRP